MSTDAEREALDAATLRKLAEFGEAIPTKVLIEAAADEVARRRLSEPVADDLVERLLHSTWGSNVADTLQSWTRQREEAAARITELQAEVERLREALQPIVEEFGSTIAQYHKIGPDYTLKDGTEVFEVSSILDRSDLIDAGLSALNTGESDAG